MKAFLALPLAALMALTPGSAGATTTPTQASEALTQSSTENAYLMAAHVAVTEPLEKDLLAAGGVIEVTAPVAGDVLGIGGTIELEEPISGDVRALGSRISVRGPVAGDLALAGASVEVGSKAHELFAAAAQVYVSDGATGSVRIYGADVTLGGIYEGDVSVTASNNLTLLPGTYIKGSLVYSAPQRVELPEGVTVEGGASYSGSYEYVPTNEQAERYALLGAALFVIVRALAGMIAAGLIVGLFPRFVRTITRWLGSDSGRRASLAGVLGLAVLFATPVLLVLFFISFVGAAVGLMLLVLYVFLLLLAHTFADILVGACLRRHVLSRITKSSEFTWRDAVAGSFLLSLIALIPVFGLTLTFILALVSLGAIVRALYLLAFND